MDDRTSLPRTAFPFKLLCGHNTRPRLRWAGRCAVNIYGSKAPLQACLELYVKRVLFDDEDLVFEKEKKIKLKTRQ